MELDYRTDYQKHMDAEELKSETMVFDDGKFPLGVFLSKLSTEDLKKLDHIVEWLDLDFLSDVADVLVKGAEKYEKDNWKLGTNYSKRLNSAFRHIHALARGIDVDPEMDTFHEANAATNLMMINYWRRKGLGEDDRPKPLKTAGGYEI